MQAWSARTTSDLEKKVHATLTASMPVLASAVVEQLAAKAGAKK